MTRNRSSFTLLAALVCGVTLARPASVHAPAARLEIPVHAGCEVPVDHYLDLGACEQLMPSDGYMPAPYSWQLESTQHPSRPAVSETRYIDIGARSLARRTQRD